MHYIEKAEFSMSNLIWGFIILGSGVSFIIILSNVFPKVKAKA